MSLIDIWLIMNICFYAIEILSQAFLKVCNKIDSICDQTLNEFWDWTPNQTPVVSLSMKLYPHCFVGVNVGSRNELEPDFTIAKLLVSISSHNKWV